MGDDEKAILDRIRTIQEIEERRIRDSTMALWSEPTVVAIFHAFVVLLSGLILAEMPIDTFCMFPTVSNCARYLAFWLCILRDRFLDET
jgi:hypothetical protein